MEIVGRCAVCVLILSFLCVDAADAQWVFLARQGVKVIQSVTNQLQTPSPGQGAEAATVLLDAAADKVYATAVKLLRENPETQVLWQDDGKLAIGFAKGDQSASMKITSLNDHLSQILVASTPGKSGGTALVVEGILRVCQRLDVACSHNPD